MLIWASPPCQGYSTAPAVGNPSVVPRSIQLMRDMLDALGTRFNRESRYRVTMYL